MPASASELGFVPDSVPDVGFVPDATPPAGDTLGFVPDVPDGGMTPEEIAAHNRVVEKGRGLPAFSLDASPPDPNAPGIQALASISSPEALSALSLYNNTDPLSKISGKTLMTPEEAGADIFTKSPIEGMLPRPTGEALPGVSEKDNLMRPVAGAVAGASELVEGLPTGFNMMLATALPEAPGPLKKAVSAYFAATMGKDAVNDLGAALEQEDPGERARLGVRAVGNALMAKFAFDHFGDRAVKGGALTAEDLKGAGLPDTPEAVAAVNKLKTRLSVSDLPGFRNPPEVDNLAASAKASHLPETSKELAATPPPISKVDAILRRWHDATDPAEKSKIWAEMVALAEEKGAPSGQEIPTPPTVETGNGQEIPDSIRPGSAQGAIDLMGDNSGPLLGNPPVEPAPHEAALGFVPDPPAPLPAPEAPPAGAGELESSRHKFADDLTYRVVTPDPKGGFRVTSLEKEDLTPVGHTEHPTLEAAVKVASDGATEHTGPIEAVPGNNAKFGAVGSNPKPGALAAIRAAQPAPVVELPGADAPLKEPEDMVRDAVAQHGSLENAAEELQKLHDADGASPELKKRVVAAQRIIGAILEAEYRREQAAEHKGEAATTKDELLDVIRKLGGLPAKNSPHFEEASGEIGDVMDAFKAKSTGNFSNNEKLGPHSSLFRGDAPSLDDLATQANQYGFNFETGYDLLDAVKRRIQTGEEHFGERDLPQGPGKMTIGELPPQRTTSLKKAVVKDERIQRGLDDLPPEERQGEEERVQSAEDRVDADPTLAPSIVKRIIEGGDHAISPDDAAVLLVERTRLGNERQAWQERKSEMADPTEADARLRDIEAQMQRLDLAQRKSLSSWGRVGHLAQRLLRSDYTLEPMLAREREVKGRALEPDEIAKVQKEADEIAAALKAADEAENAEALQREAEAVQHTHDIAAAGEAPKLTFDKRVLKIAENIVSKWESTLEDDRKALRSALGYANVGPNPAAILPLARIIRAKIGRFGLDLGKITASLIAEFGEDVRSLISKAYIKAQQMIDKEVKDSATRKKVKEGTPAAKTPKTPVDVLATAKALAVAKEPLSHRVVFDLVRALLRAGVKEADVMQLAHANLKDLFPDATQRDVNRAYVDYGKKLYPSKDELKVTERHLRQAVKISEDITRLEQDKLRPEKQGYQRDKADIQIRELMRKRNDLLKTTDIPPDPGKLASVDEAKQTHLKNAIEEMDRQIQTEEKVPRAPGAPDSPIVERLKRELGAMRDLWDEIDARKNPPPTPEQLQIDSLSKIKQRLDDKLTGAADPVKRADFEPLTQQAEDMHAEILAMRELVAQLRRDAKPPVDVDGKREAAQIKALEKTVEDYGRKYSDLMAGKGKSPTKRLGPDSARVAELKAIVHQRAEMYRLAEKAGKPVRTPEQRINDVRVKGYEKRGAEIQAKIDAGDFSKPAKIKVPLSSEAEKARAVYEAKKLAFDRGVEKQRLADRSWSQKFWDGFVAIERAMKLTSDVVLAKLTLAAIAREGALTPAEEVAGGGFSKVFSRLAARAPREGGLSLTAEMQAKAALFTDGLKDAWQNLKFHESGLELAHGKNRIAPPAWWEYMGFLHAALKAPVKRAEFTRSLAKRMAWAVKDGRDVNDPAVMAELSQEAYVDGARSIFLQDNVVSDAINSAIRRMELSKVAPKLGPGLARVARFLVPIVKVPTNIVGEVATGVHGLGVGGARAAVAYLKGIEDLSPAEADTIMRQLKKGAVGNSLLLAGYFGYKSIGGFYHDRDRRNKSDVPVGRYRIGGWDAPASFSHSTGAMLLNIGATVHRVAEERVKGSAKGFAEGVRAGAAGVIEQLPFIPAATGIIDSIREQDGFARYINYLITGTLEPAILQHAAKIRDTPGSFPSNAFVEANKRKPHTLGETLKAGVPGLRETVPLKH